MSKHNHYFVDVSNLDSVDVYRMIELIGITCPVAQHVFKKAWATGKRGHKDLRRDWQDVADSAARKLRMIDEDNGWASEAIRAASFGQQNTFAHRTEEQKTTDWPDKSRRGGFVGGGYTGQGGVMICCPDCSAEHCPCVAG